MGYYHRFRGAISQKGADFCILLSRPPLYFTLAGKTSLDLHISGTPPAFILSQDQTLKKIVGFPNPITRLNKFYVPMPSC